jgi:stage II sporulation protein M
MFNILFNPKKAERHPLEMMIIGIIYSSISILLASIIFLDYATLVMVFFTVLSCFYVIQSAIKLEEKKAKDYKSERWVLSEHFKLINLFLFLFLGFVISFCFWTIVLPQEKVDILFSLQHSVVEGIKTMSSTGNTYLNESFLIIFENNIKVLIISLLFAFFYGAGAIFVLVWNASVMGYVIGNIAKNILGIKALPLVLTKYFLHGIPEMLSYIVIVLCGGIIYTAISRGDFFKEGRAKRLIIDILALISLSLILLLLAALIEVYISPYI